MIYTNKGRRKEDKESMNISLAFDNEKLKAALRDSEAEVARLKNILESQNLEDDQRFMYDLMCYAKGLENEHHAVGILEEHEDGGVFIVPTVNFNNLPIGTLFYLDEPINSSLKSDEGKESEQ